MAGRYMLSRVHVRQLDNDTKV